MAGGRRGSRLVQWGSTVAWAIVPESLATMAEIATREPLSEEDLALVAQRLGRPLDNSHATELRGPVAVIPVIGPIFRYADGFSALSGGTTVDTLALDFAQCLANPQVGAILLNVDSPGGEATGIAELSAQIAAARGVKPVVAYVGGDCCSAAYWLASAADSIVIDSIAQVGSIGAVMAVPNPDANPRAATRLEFVSSQSPKKRTDPRTEAGRSQLQVRVDALAAVFIAGVAANRGMSEEAVAATEGEIFIGQAAIGMGLADRLGSFEGVIAELTADLAGGRSPLGGRLAAMGTGEEVGMAERGFWARFWGGMGAQMDANPAMLAMMTGALGQDGAPPEVPTLAEAAALPAVRPAQAGAPSEPDPEVVALRAQLAALRSERQAAIEARMGDAAAAFADGEIAACRAFPAEREALVAAYCDAARDDLALGAIAGASADTGGATRVDRLVARSATRPPHTLTQEVVPTREGAATVLANAQRTQFGPTDAQPDAPLTPEERDRLLAMTEVGRAVLAERRAAGR